MKRSNSPARFSKRPKIDRLPTNKLENVLASGEYEQFKRLPCAESIVALIQKLEAEIAEKHDLLTSLQGLAVPIGCSDWNGRSGQNSFENDEQLRNGILDAYAQNQKNFARMLADAFMKQHQLLEATSPTSHNASRLVKLQGDVMQLENKSQRLKERVAKKNEELLAAQKALRELAPLQAAIKTFAEHEHPHPAESGQLFKDALQLCESIAPQKISLLDAVSQQYIVGRLVTLQSSHVAEMKLSDVVGPTAAKQEIGSLAADARVLFFALRSGSGPRGGSNERLDFKFYVQLMLDAKSQQQLKSLLRNSLRSMTAFLAHVRVTYCSVNMVEGSSYTVLTRGQVLYFSLRYLAACQYMQLAHTGGHNALLAVTSVLGHRVAAEVDIDELHEEFCRAAHSLSAAAGQPVVTDVLGGIIKNMWKAGFSHFYGQRRVDLAEAVEQAAVAAAVRQALAEVPVIDDT